LLLGNNHRPRLVETAAGCDLYPDAASESWRCAIFNLEKKLSMHVQWRQQKNRLRDRLRGCMAGLRTAVSMKQVA